MKTRMQKALSLFCLLILLITIAPNASADAEHAEFAKSNEMAAVKEVSRYGMTPIAASLLADGTWPVEVKSSSQFFRVERCELVVEQGEMVARMTMSSYSYSLLYMGTGEEAAAAPYEDYIEFDRVDDYYVFTIPVKALNEPISCASYSKRKKKWYSRQLLFDAASLPEEALNGLTLPDYQLIEKALEAYDSPVDEDGLPTSTVVALGGNMDADNPAYGEAMEINLPDGRYSINVDIAGGSGRATVSTPTLLLVQDGKAYARLLWSSVYYDWMQVGGVTYPNETTDGGNSTFTIPVSSLDSLIPVVADTTAMGDPVAIQYTLTFYRESIGDEGLIPQEAAKKVVITAVIMIVVGFFLNLFLKKKRKKK